eukprot:CAMPEP_0168579636 /NCGR_PEP_ID=MMETSP0420-20121227/337_1 /TAXON_ID=498008 /ORGANISM="Pessonella sp." /LENGTH=339 /DNA_ID=CAMNT_0008613635 /DNA_START=1984 /DNA_END=3000 /DNA_ORIENTATION=+
MSHGNFPPGFGGQQPYSSQQVGSRPSSHQQPIPSNRTANYHSNQQDLLAMLTNPSANAYNPQRSNASPGTSPTSGLAALTSSAGATGVMQPSNTNDSISFDMSSFPALSAGGTETQPEQPLNLVGDEFPALGGSGGRDSNNSNNNNNKNNNNNNNNNNNHNNNNNNSNKGNNSNASAAARSGAGDGTTQRPAEAGGMFSGSAGGRGMGSSSDAAASTGAAGVVIDEAHRYTLLGLLNVIRMTDADRNTLALGTDLTTLGLNLNSSETLYATFTSPFAERQTKREPDFYLPACYYTQPPMQPAHTKIANFADEILFYIFYSMPNDTMQLYAAAELYKREW